MSSADAFWTTIKLLTIPLLVPSGWLCMTTRPCARTRIITPVQLDPYWVYILSHIYTSHVVLWPIIPVNVSVILTLCSLSTAWQQQSSGFSPTSCCKSRFLIFLFVVENWSFPPLKIRSLLSGFFWSSTSVDCGMMTIWWKVGCNDHCVSWYILFCSVLELKLFYVLWRPEVETHVRNDPAYTGQDVSSRPPRPAWSSPVCLPVSITPSYCFFITPCLVSFLISSHFCMFPLSCLHCVSACVSVACYSMSSCLSLTVSQPNLDTTRVSIFIVLHHYVCLCVP